MTNPNHHVPEKSVRTGKRPGMLLVRVEYLSGAGGTYDVPARALMRWEAEQREQIGDEVVSMSFREWLNNPLRDMTRAYRLAWITLNLRNPKAFEKDAETGGELFDEWLDKVAACDVVDQEADPTQQPSPADSPPSLDA